MCALPASPHRHSPGLPWPGGTASKAPGRLLGVEVAANEHRTGGRGFGSPRGARAQLEQFVDALEDEAARPAVQREDPPRRSRSPGWSSSTLTEPTAGSWWWSSSGAPGAPDADRSGSKAPTPRMVSRSTPAWRKAVISAVALRVRSRVLRGGSASGGTRSVLSTTMRSVQAISSSSSRTACARTARSSSSPSRASRCTARMPWASAYPRGSSAPSQAWVCQRAPASRAGETEARTSSGSA